jgi:hypothetical protein
MDGALIGALNLDLNHAYVLYDIPVEGTATIVN